MLRDGQFLREEPINIGGGWAPEFTRDDYTPEEIFMQKALLGDEPGLRLPDLSVGWWLVAVFTAIHVVLWALR